MINATIDLARLFLDGYQNKTEKETGAERIRETIHRELKLNAELVTEARRVSSDQPALANALLSRMETEGFDALSAAGLPLAKIFSTPWSVSDHPALSHRNRFEGITRVAELVERAYHRIRIQQIRSSVGQDKDSRSLGYLAVLLGKASQATNPSR